MIRFMFSRKKDELFSIDNIFGFMCVSIFVQS